MSSQPAICAIHAQPTSAPVPTDRRTAPRLRLPAMYTHMQAHRLGDKQYRWSGHIYDISLSGMRFELDERLEIGAAIEGRLMLSGRRHALLRVAGRVVRIHEDDDATVPPVRMAMVFEQFVDTFDRHRLDSYLADVALRRRRTARRRRAA